MVRRYMLYIAVLFLMGVVSAPMAYSSAHESYIWLTVGDLTKEKDGSINRYFTLHAGEPTHPETPDIKYITAFYRIYRVSRYSEPTVNSEWKLYTLQKQA